MAKDRRVQLLKRRRRLDAQLLHEHPTGFLVRLERLGLPSAPIQGEHELPAGSLPERIVAHEPFELPDELRSAAKFQLGLDPLLDRGQAELLEAGRFVLGEALVGEVAERCAAPELERFPHRARPGARPPQIAPRSRAARNDAHRLPPPLHRARSQGSGLDDVRPERLSELRHRVLERRRGSRRRALTPEVRDQALTGNNLADVHGEDGEHGALSLSAELESPLAVPNLEWTKDPKLEHALFVTPFCQPY